MRNGTCDAALRKNQIYDHFIFRSKNLSIILSHPCHGSIRAWPWWQSECPFARDSIRFNRMNNCFGSTANNLPRPQFFFFVDVFRRNNPNPTASLCTGSLVALLCFFVCHCRSFVVATNWKMFTMSTTSQQIFSDPADQSAHVIRQSKEYEYWRTL